MATYQNISGIYNWIVKTMKITFVDLNSWIENWDFGRNGLHMNQSGMRRLNQSYSRVCGFGGERISMSNCC
jgi:hypothetical protein